MSTEAIYLRVDPRMKRKLQAIMDQVNHERRLIDEKTPRCTLQELLTHGIDLVFKEFETKQKKVRKAP
jgi:hypothetical protein